MSGGGRIDRRTGEVWPQAAIDYAIEVAEIGEDAAYPDRWLWVWCEGSRPGYRNMVWFISDVDDPEIADRLRIAIRGCYDFLQAHTRRIRARRGSRRLKHPNDQGFPSC